MILIIHHRYRTLGGEEQAAHALATIVRTQLGEEVVMLERDSQRVRSASAAAGVLAGGLRPDQVGRAVRGVGARIVHAHNLQPTFGWRSLAAAREAGARVVLHLHQYRLVCAIGVGFRDGHECTACHGRNTLPGVLHNCRGARGEALAYGAGLAAWQRAMLSHADAVVVPSAFARDRLCELGLPVSGAFVVPNPVGESAVAERGDGGPRSGALVVSRLAPEKGVDVAVDACARAGIALTVAGDGPERAALVARARAAGGAAEFLGRVSGQELARLRARAAVAVVPSRSAETYGLAAAEAMAAGLPVAASRIGALPELVPDPWLAPAGDADALATVITRLAADADAGPLGRRLVQRHAGPEVVAQALRAAYAAASA
jgi:glycosyltransferase involved in cell wall biosynthesis